MKKIWKRFLAYWRLDLMAVCEESKGRNLDNDYHDYPDSFIGEPLHMYTHVCKRCGKEFII